MQVLVTGANGLLGSNLVRELLAAGHRVRVCVRRESNLSGIADLAVERCYGDVREPDAMRRAVDGCEIVYHCAAVFSYWGYSLQDMESTARVGVLTAIDAARDAGVRRMVLTSSTAVLGGNATGRVVDESARLVGNGFPDYFATKVLQEDTALNRAAEVGLELVVVNPTVFVGPHDFRPSTSLAIITSYLGDPMRFTFAGGINLCHAADVAQGHMIAAERGVPGQRHILGADNLSWSTVHRTISELCGTYGPGLKVGRRPALMAATLMEAISFLTGQPPSATRAMARQVGRYFWYSSAKMRALGFAPRSTRHALADTIAWYLESPLIGTRRRRHLKPSGAVPLGKYCKPDTVSGS